MCKGEAKNAYRFVMGKPEDQCETQTKLSLKQKPTPLQ